MHLEDERGMRPFNTATLTPVPPSGHTWPMGRAMQRAAAVAVAAALRLLGILDPFSASSFVASASDLSRSSDFFRSSTRRLCPAHRASSSRARGTLRRRSVFA
jgi:hypothetical protein